jgi:hypothetical protein
MHPLIKAYINLSTLLDLDVRDRIWFEMIRVTREFIREFEEEWPCPTIEYAI